MTAVHHFPDRNGNDHGIVLPDSQVVDELELEDLVDLLTRGAALMERARARLTMLGHGTKSADEEYLTIEDVAALIHVSPDWVYRQAAKWGFAVKIAPKIVRVQRAGLLRWIAQRNR